MSRAVNINASRAHVEKTCAKLNAATTVIEDLDSGGTRVVFKERRGCRRRREGLWQQSSSRCRDPDTDPSAVWCFRLARCLIAGGRRRPIIMCGAYHAVCSGAAATSGATRSIDACACRRHWSIYLEQPAPMWSVVYPVCSLPGLRSSSSSMGSRKLGFCVDGRRGNSSST